MRKEITIILFASAVLIAAAFLTGCTEEAGTTAGSSADTVAAQDQDVMSTVNVDRPLREGDNPTEMQMNGTHPSGDPPEGMAMNMTRPQGEPPANMPEGMEPSTGERPSGTPPEGSGPAGQPSSGTPPDGEVPVQ